MVDSRVAQVPSAIKDDTPVPALSVPDLALVDRPRLYLRRRERFQAALREKGIEAALLFHPANIRYVTGTSMMAVWTLGTFERYCLVPAEGEPILFEYRAAFARSSELVTDVRPAITWQFLGVSPHEAAAAFSAQIEAAREELGVDGPMALDRCDLAGILALQSRGIRLCDASEAVQWAREVKLPEEIALLAHAGAIGDAMLASVETVIRPGITELQLFAEMHDQLIRMGGEVTIARLVASGRNTNPWMQESTGKPVMPGDVVGVDTDANGPEGYFIDVSRTFFCGDRPSVAQRDLYRRALDHLLAMVDAVKPGISYASFARSVPDIPDKFRAQRYPDMVHGAGLEDEGPLIGYADEMTGTVAEEQELKEGMVLCLESYFGEVGGIFGIKLEDQVVVTSSGGVRLSTYPFDARFLD